MSEKRFSEAKVDFQCAIETKGQFDNKINFNGMILMMLVTDNSKSGDREPGNEMKISVTVFFCTYETVFF